ncbi:alpha/beta fold hydrolase [Kineococcus sp. SYSU DK003]|uniref:alpha/beta fold hydrolase n=1 Tax=Kineococcus sp. SYSU DK003 TaxID=3383124 RepID=UPI003D7E2287
MLTGTAAGVPYVVLPPATARPEAPVVVGWHLLDPPRTPEAFAAALPLEGLDAWRVFLGLPLSGSRMPAGGFEQVLRLAARDVIAELHGRIALEALAEFPAAFAAIRTRLGLGDGPVALLGGSMGAMVAQLVAASGALDVRALALVSPLVDLRATLPFIAEALGIEVRWTPENEATADRMDFVRRAGELAGLPLLVVTGDEDVPVFLDVVAAQAGRLPGARQERIAGMGHALADEPGTGPAPQTPHAAQVDAVVTAFLREHLS